MRSIRPPSTHAHGLLRIAPVLTLGLLLGPILAGAAGTMLPAFGYFPALGGSDFGLEPWRRLGQYPGIGAAVIRSLATGFAATLLSFILAVGLCAAAHDSRALALVRRCLSPLLSVPHATLAIGLMFMIAPGGWIARAVSPWASGWQTPPDLPLAPDPYGFGLVLALVIKEVPFLFLMILSALNQVPAAQSLAQARVLGYAPVTAWMKTVFPAVYAQIRLPLFAVLAFSVSVADMALITLGATTPTLSVLVLRWAHDPDLSFQFVAAAGSLLQFLLAVGLIGLWCVLEIVVRRLGRAWIARGARRTLEWTRPVIEGAAGLTTALGIAGLVSLAIWAMAWRWRWPDALPGVWSLENLRRHGAGLIEPAATGVATGLAAALIAVALTLACLEAEQRLGRRPTSRAMWLLYLPLIIPQLSFLFGVQILLIRAGLDGSWPALVWMHLMFVTPYVYLSLSEPYRRLDERYARAGLCLGASPGRVFWRIKLPILLRPLLIAMAIGFAVSLGQYLPTLFAGGGRLTTLTTEAVALSSGGDRRLIGLYGILMTLLPLCAFLLAGAVPSWRYRYRLNMRQGALI